MSLSCRTSSEGKRIVIVQYAGDYREAVGRLSSGGAETYFAQHYSVESVAALTGLADEVTVLACVTEMPYSEVLANGVRAIGGGFNRKIPIRSLLKLVDQQRPTHLVVSTPLRKLVHWAADHEVRTLALFADSFPAGSIRARYRNRRLANALNRASVDWVGNHNVNASRSLEELGVDASKIIPWDWVPSVTPDQFESKLGMDSQSETTLMYAGSISEQKGVSDLIRAIAILKERGIFASLQLAGKGDADRFKALAVKLGIAERVFFLGLLPNDEVVQLMRQADAVVIPSRHEYAEGLPMTIYEALSSRTPIVASDHPMFRGKLTHGESALIFAAAQPTDLAAKVELLFGHHQLYSALSHNAAAAWRRIQIPVKFGELLKRWILDSAEDRTWISSHRLASGKYDGL